jgi:hypothetical protein
LEVPVDTGFVQSDHSECCALAIHRICQHQCCKLGRNSNHVVQVPSTLPFFFLPCRTDLSESLLFTGLLINRETVVPALQWLHTISFFHAAFEALAVNELRYLQLKEVKVNPVVICEVDVIDNDL